MSKPSLIFLDTDQMHRGLKLSKHTKLCLERYVAIELHIKYIKGLL